ncbi:uncharacterized protein BO87DRAFT_321333 [Aspergillus neoniger CBS 115656]|uniref:RING-type domain-containing protein n=1 Tax=Aspergillus neoniger (strain CBS 115656) TaxID=1448310 RepID=A0A318YU39_ASPNB|nr:hypothetical protein BO87DRAFT_321333 [Aspergillus neoniger CBS 115656]PYH28822.1 hypothetical protein BO87DRAFT_321333 [Aspergillus neoniger CBS 115656]
MFRSKKLTGTVFNHMALTMSGGYKAQSVDCHDRDTQRRYAGYLWLEISLTHRLNEKLKTRWLLENEHQLHQALICCRVTGPALEDAPCFSNSFAGIYNFHGVRARIQLLRQRLEKEQELIDETMQQRKAVRYRRSIRFCHMCIGSAEGLVNMSCGHRICCLCMSSLPCQADRSSQAPLYECGLCWKTACAVTSHWEQILNPA